MSDCSQIPSIKGALYFLFKLLLICQHWVQVGKNQFSNKHTAETSSPSMLWATSVGGSWKNGWMVCFLSYCMDCCSIGCLLHILRHCWGASLREEDIQRETTASDWLMSLKGPPIRHHPQYVTVCFPLWFWMHRVSLHIFSRLQFCMHAWSYVCMQDAKIWSLEGGGGAKIEMLWKQMKK